MADQEKPHFKGGRLTRAGMEAAIRRGESVQLKNGRVLIQLADLPSEAELVAREADPVAKQEVREDLQRKIAELQAQMALLQSPASVAQAGTPVTQPFDDWARSNLGNGPATALATVGIASVEELFSLTEEALRGISGIGEATVSKVHELRDRA